MSILRRLFPWSHTKRYILARYKMPYSCPSFRLTLFSHVAYTSLMRKGHHVFAAPLGQNDVRGGCPLCSSHVAAPRAAAEILFGSTWIWLCEPPSKSQRVTHILLVYEHVWYFVHLFSRCFMVYIPERLDFFGQCLGWNHLVRGRRSRWSQCTPLKLLWSWAIGEWWRSCWMPGPTPRAARAARARP